MANCIWVSDCRIWVDYFVEGRLMPYHMLADGEEFEVNPDAGMLLACCDCGLVHKVEIKIIDSDWTNQVRLSFKLTKDTKETKIRRKELHDKQASDTA
jgi:hypothetical protein